MKKKILVYGLGFLFLVLMLTAELNFRDFAKALDESIAQTGGREVRSFLMKEDGVLNFYIDSQIEDYAAGTNFKNYKTISGVAICVNTLCFKHSLSLAGVVWFLRNGEKVARLEISDCVKFCLLSKKDKGKATTHLFESISLFQVSK